MSLSQGAGAASNKWEKEALEESRRLVETLFEGVEQMDVQLLGLVNVLAHSVENDHLEKSLDNGRLSRNENSSSLVTGVW